MTLLRWATGRRISVRRLAAVDVALALGDHVEILVGLQAFPARPAAQEIERRIVGDAKQPALGVGDGAGARKGLDRLGQRLLQDILAIDHRARHARAVAVQPGPELRQELVEACLRVVHAFL
jgi:hypothetical protein